MEELLKRQIHVLGWWVLSIVKYIQFVNKEVTNLPNTQTWGET
jgi:hypothetical protein